MHRPQSHTASRRGARLLQRACCALLALAMAFAALPAPARAADDGSLTLQVNYVSGGTTTPVSGVTAGAYLVADLDDAINHYELRPEFAQLDVSFDEGLDAQTMAALAQQAAQLVSSGKVKPVANATSNAKGEASFGTLPKGIYLVIQTASTGAAEGYTSLDPFLISVPQITEEGVVFEVTALPKLGLKPQDKMPQTSDPFDAKLWTTCLVAGGVLVVAGLIGRGRSRKDEREADGQ